MPLSPSQANLHPAPVAGLPVDPGTPPHLPTTRHRVPPLARSNHALSDPAGSSWGWDSSCARKAIGRNQAARARKQKSTSISTMAAPSTTQRRLSRHHHPTSPTSPPATSATRSVREAERPTLSLNHLTAHRQKKKHPRNHPPPPMCPARSQSAQHRQPDRDQHEQRQVQRIPKIPRPQAKSRHQRLRQKQKARPRYGSKACENTEQTGRLLIA